MILLLKNWKLILGAVTVSVAFLSGWTVNGWRYDARLHTIEQKAEKERLERAKEASKIVEENSHAETRIRTVYRDRIKTVYRYRGPAKCIDDDGLRFVERWNETSRQADKPDGGMPSG